MKVATIVVGISALFLLVITYSYRQQTKATRETAQRPFDIQSRPQVFLSDIEAVSILNDYKKAIEVSAAFEIKNTGTIRANNLSGDYSFSSGKLKLEGTAGTVPYLFPRQKVVFQTEMMAISLNDSTLEAMREWQFTDHPKICYPQYL